MDNQEKTTNNLGEAPASATVKIKSPAGFEYLFTMRDEKASNLLFKMAAMEKHFLDKGFTALAQNASKFPPKPEKEYTGKICPLDGGRLVKPPVGSKAPIKCENNKWNNMTKQSYGCQYIEWPNANPQPDVPERDISQDY